uniref:IS110 family transposase n=1 Tax=Yersinia enterocolitica TaxID=630 RepID=UPI001CBCB35B
MLGVDTHLDIHVGAVLSYDGKLLGTKVIQTNQVGYEELFDWVLTFGSVERAGIEGTGTYGAGLTRFLIKKGLDVLEINRPDRSKRRLKGKSDPLDAENAARTVLSGSAKAVPKLQSGACEALRIISVARRSAVKAKIQVINQLRALLVSAPQDIRDMLWKSKPLECVTACMSFESAEKSPLLLALCCTLRSLAKRWLAFAEELTQLDELLDNLTQEYAGSLRRQFGVGPQTAAILLAVAGDNPERLKNEAALASLCGVNPLPASSGKTIRHRLNRGGSREANNALWTIALVRMRSDPRTKVYVQRRTGEGLSTKEILRCLKRYIVRELYPLILTDLGRAQLRALT